MRSTSSRDGAAASASARNKHNPRSNPRAPRTNYATDSTGFPILTDVESATIWCAATAESWNREAFTQEHGPGIAACIEQCRAGARGKNEATILQAMRRLNWECWLRLDTEIKALHMLEADGYEKWQAQLAELRAAHEHGTRLTLAEIRARPRTACIAAT